MKNDILDFIDSAWADEARLEMYERDFYDRAWDEMCYQAQWMGYGPPEWDEGDDMLKDLARERWIVLMIATNGNHDRCSIAHVLNGLVQDHLEGALRRGTR